MTTCDRKQIYRSPKTAARTHQGHRAIPGVTAVCYLDYSDGFTRALEHSNIRRRLHGIYPDRDLSTLGVLVFSWPGTSLLVVSTAGTNVLQLSFGSYPDTYRTRILPVLICPIIWVPMAASFSSLVLSAASLLLPSHSRFKPNTLYGSRQRPSHAFHILSRGRDFCLSHRWMLNY